jgi:hypothetical protein
MVPSIHCPKALFAGLNQRLTDKDAGVICCLFAGVRTVALFQKPGGIAPASGSAAARRSTSSSPMSRKALFKGFGAGMSSRPSYLTIRPRFFEGLAIIPVRLPGRDEAEIPITSGENQSDHLAVIFAKRNEALLAVIAPVSSATTTTPRKNFGRLAKTDAVLAPVRSIFGLIPLESYPL